MVHTRFKGSDALPASMGPSTPVGVEGEMFRVSISSLLEGAGVTAAPEADTGGGYHLLTPVGPHGMIQDLYSSGAVAGTILDSGMTTALPDLITAVAPIAVIQHELFDALPGGEATASVAASLPLAFGGDWHGSFADAVSLADQGGAMFAAVASTEAGFGDDVHGGTFAVDNVFALGAHLSLDAFYSSSTPIVDLHLLA